MSKIDFTVLVILDGWGIAPDADSNAVSRASTPYFDSLAENYPAAVLDFFPSASNSRESAYLALGTGSLGQLDSRSSLGEFLRKKNCRQLRLGESENIALPTDFFDAGKVPIGSYYQVKIIPTPAMNGHTGAEAVSREAATAVKSGQFDFIALNFIDADRLCADSPSESIIAGIGEIDSGLKKIIESVLDRKGQAVLIGSFGRAEASYDIQTDERSKTITANPVPFLVIAEKYQGKRFNWPDFAGKDLDTAKPAGSTLDFYPSFLSLLGFRAPAKGEGRSIIKG